MGTNYYFRRDDNRTRYFVGKQYALARHFEREYGAPDVGRGHFVVTGAPARDAEWLARAASRRAPIAFVAATIDATIDARDLAEIFELAEREDGCAEAQVAPTGRDQRGTSIYLLSLALDVARWADGMPISLVGEDCFEDWQFDDAWDDDASTMEFADPDDATPNA